jgi:hypothetical protein
MPGEAPATEPGGYRQVQDFALSGRHGARYEKRRNLPVIEGHEEVVTEVVRGVPLGGRGAGGLNVGHGGKIVYRAGPDRWHYCCIMHTFLALLFLFAPPFWEVKQPQQWSDRECNEMLHNSPWAESAGPDPAMRVFLATARPIEDAEAELRIRGVQPLHEADPDYTDYASRNHDTELVLAIDYQDRDPNWSAEDIRRMQDESFMLVGRRKHRMVGYFPPTPSDPVLRLAFPRDVQPADKRVVFRLYLPGISFPERDAEFEMKDLLYRGKLEM